MTTPEHTLVGLHLAFALGGYHRYGWPVVAFSALASNIPDWDGIPMLFDMQRFESGHRVWGHNLWMIILSSLVIAWTQHRFRWLQFVARKLSSYLPASSSSHTPTKNESLLVFVMAAVLAQLIHLPCDMVVSGGQGLSDWLIKPLWPLSDAGYVYPLIRWGDVGPTIIMMAGCFGLAKLPHRQQLVSSFTLLTLVAYLCLRGLWLH